MAELHFIPLVLVQQLFASHHPRQLHCRATTLPLGDCWTEETLTGALFSGLPTWVCVWLLAHAFDWIYFSIDSSSCTLSVCGIARISYLEKRQRDVLFRSIECISVRCGSPCRKPPAVLSHDTLQQSVASDRHMDCTCTGSLGELGTRLGFRSHRCTYRLTAFTFNFLGSCLLVRGDCLQEKEKSAVQRPPNSTMFILTFLSSMTIMMTCSVFASDVLSTFFRGSA